ncbi:unnamed protein product [Mytilus coruscus]|uniref:DZIP3-like HEPN domain-containing protein n=1 Tax=Mytilus coruscus TaxID=42192 RepID=A0A6J8BJH9_MYTCO|nr:unnamed protein product [Mytilus coruscus]
MPVTSKDRQAILGGFLLKLFPKIMQLILKDNISPRGLKMKFLLKDIRISLTQSEITLLEKLPKMDKFTVELCYKILRYENLMLEPKCKWGNILHDTELEIADDIQRIINTTNDVISKKCDEITEVYYNELKETIENVTKRVDAYLHQDICLKMYKTICSSDLHPAEILQKLTRLQTIDVSIKLTHIVHTKTDSPSSIE